MSSNSGESKDSAKEAPPQEVSSQEPVSPPKRKRIPALIPPNNNLGEDELLLKGFYDLMQIKADKGEFQRIMDEPNDRRAVKKALMPSFYLASATAITTFVVLRKAPRWFMNQALSKKESIIHGPAGHPHYDSSRRTKEYFVSSHSNPSRRIYLLSRRTLY